MTYSSFTSKLLLKGPVNYIPRLKTEELMTFCGLENEPLTRLVDYLRIRCEFRDTAWDSQVQVMISITPY